jgi:membrane glycosyltransferase
MLPAPRRPRIDPLNIPLLTGGAKLAEAMDFERVWPTLSAEEKVMVLSDNATLSRLVELYHQ